VSIVRWNLQEVSTSHSSKETCEGLNNQKSQVTGGKECDMENAEYIGNDGFLQRESVENEEYA